MPQDEQKGPKQQRPVQDPADEARKEAEKARVAAEEKSKRDAIKKSWRGRRDYYECLGVSRTASAQEVKKAFRALAQIFHPDKTKGDKEAEGMFIQMKEASECLIDPEKRAIYDRAGVEGVKEEERRKRDQHQTEALRREYDGSSPEQEARRQFDAWANDFLREGIRGGAREQARAAFMQGFRLYDVIAAINNLAKNEAARLGVRLGFSDPLYVRIKNVAGEEFEKVQRERARGAGQDEERRRREQEQRQREAQEAEKVSRKEALAKWLKDLEEYAYKELKRGVVYAKILEIIEARVGSGLSGGEKEEYGEKAEKAARNAWKKWSGERRREFENWSGEWFNKLAVEVQASLNAGLEGAVVKRVLMTQLEEKLKFLEEDARPAERSRAQVIIDAAIASHKPKEKATERHENDKHYEQWAEQEMGTFIPQKIRQAHGVLTEDEVIAAAVARLGTHRVVGVTEATYKKYEKAATELVKKIYAEMGEEKSEVNKNREKGEAWLKDLPRMMLIWLESHAEDKVRRTADTLLKEKLGALPDAERKTFIERQNEVLSQAVLARQWLAGIPLFAGQKFQEGRGRDAVLAFLRAQFDGKMKLIGIKEDAHYRKKLDELLGKISQAHDETLGKGQGINDFFKKVAS